MNKVCILLSGGVPTYSFRKNAVLCKISAKVVVVDVKIKHNENVSTQETNTVESSLLKTAAPFFRAVGERSVCPCSPQVGKAHCRRFSRILLLSTFTSSDPNCLVSVQSKRLGPSEIWSGLVLWHTRISTARCFRFPLCSGQACFPAACLHNLCTRLPWLRRCPDKTLRGSNSQGSPQTDGYVNRQKLELVNLVG